MKQDYRQEYQAARHFTDYALQLATGDPNAKVDPALTEIVHSQNPIWHILRKHSDVAPHWWIRHGACDKDTSLPIVTNLATAIYDLGKNVSARLIWDGGHCADDDTEGFIIWMKDLCK